MTATATEITHITVDPTIYGAAFKAGELSQYIAWAMMREHNAVSGQHERDNRIARRDAIAVQCSLRQIGRRRAEQILKAGKGPYWREDSRQRLWLVGHGKLARRLGVTPRFPLRSVPVEQVRDRAGMTATAVNLQLELADDPRPITRKRKAERSGVSGRQQQRIDASDRGSALVEQVYALYDTQLPDGAGSFTDSRGRRLRRIGDIRMPPDHLAASRSQTTNFHRRAHQLRQPQTDKAVTATDEAPTRRRVFSAARRKDAALAWERAGKPRGMLAYPSRGRWQRELVEDPAHYFT